MSRLLVNNSYDAKISVASLMVLFKFITVVLNGHLLGMHIYLHFTNQTTYEWIIKRKGKNKIQDIESNENENFDSNNAMAKKDAKRSSLMIYRSKFIHKQKDNKNN